MAKPIGAHPHHHLRLIMPTPALSALTTVGLGGIPTQFESVKTESELVELVRSASSIDRPLLLLGGGSNIVAQDGSLDATVVKLALRGISIKHQRDKVLVTVGAGETWHDFVEEMTSEGFAGLECLGGIPGSVGATPIQNVGAYGQEVSQVIAQVRVLNRKTFKFRSLRGQDCAFGYRSSLFKTSARERYVVASVTFALTPDGAPSLNYAELKRALPGDAPLVDVFNEVVRLRRSKSMVYDPKDENHRSCGSFFVNPQLTPAQWAALQARLGTDVPHFFGEQGSVKVPAAWLIERAGFAKGMRVGPVGLSSKHALCLVAHDGATAAHLIGLAQFIRQRVESELGVRLIPEPDFWGFDRLDDRLPVVDFNEAV
jgi:UDP-N-acetylmuramate dehydrogenase